MQRPRKEEKKSHRTAWRVKRILGGSRVNTKLEIRLKPALGLDADAFLVDAVWLLKTPIASVSEVALSHGSAVDDADRWLLQA